LSPPDVKFATCSDDQSIKVWDLATCELEATLTGACGRVGVWACGAAACQPRLSWLGAGCLLANALCGA
jgi:WD40 repeat protein